MPADVRVEFSGLGRARQSGVRPLRCSGRPGSGAGARLLCNYLLRAAGWPPPARQWSWSRSKAHARRTASVATFLSPFWP